MPLNDGLAQERGFDGSVPGSAPGGAQGKSRGSRGFASIALVVASRIPVLGVCSFVFFAVDGSEKVGWKTPVPMHLADVPGGFPAHLSKEVLSALAATHIECAQSSRLNSGHKGDKASGTTCLRAINGNFGQAIIADDKE